MRAKYFVPQIVLYLRFVVHNLKFLKHPRNDRLKRMLMQSKSPFKALGLFAVFRKVTATKTDISFTITLAVWDSFLNEVFACHGLSIRT